MYVCTQLKRALPHAQAFTCGVLVVSADLWLCAVGFRRMSGGRATVSQGFPQRVDARTLFPTVDIAPAR